MPGAFELWYSVSSVKVVSAAGFQVIAGAIVNRLSLPLGRNVFASRKAPVSR